MIPPLVPVTPDGGTRMLIRLDRRRQGQTAAAFVAAAGRINVTDHREAQVGG